MEPLPEIEEGKCPEWTNTNKSQLSEILPALWNDQSLQKPDPFKCKIIQAIQPCLHVPDEPGILIPSIFALKQWKKVYDPLIEKFHSIKPDYIHNFTYDSDFSLSAISKEDNDKYILSSRVRANRNFAGFPHSMKLDKE